MSNINLKYAALVGLLSSLDDNVVTDEDYELIKNSNINDDAQQGNIIESIVVPWFQS
ncbi:hypothetical protein G5645_22300, partial [Pectobacterium carotovorum]|nr:hypothetical protein [Pectobacterium carotovorum]